jgi:hypothetical protein
LAVICGVTTGYTYQRTRRDVSTAQEKIAAAAKNVIQLEKDDETE